MERIPPKQKAKELINKFKDENYFDERTIFNEAKSNAKILLNEIINCDSFFKTLDDSKEFVSYWYNVQEELLKLEEC